MSYESYLQSIGLSPGQDGRNHVTMHNLVRDFDRWLSKRGLDIQTAGYKDLMDYVGYLQSQGKGVHRINHALRSIGHYYDYRGWPNIAQTTRIRGVARTQPQGLLTEEELGTIYDSFYAEPHRNRYHYTDKLMLGLIIYQGLDMQEFTHIELQDMKLERGLIYVRSGRQKRERYVPLKASQVLSLDRYTREVRPQLANTASEKLLSPQADDYNQLHYQFKLLSQKVKAHASDLDIHIHKLNQLRQSRIAIWVKEEGLRKAQYFAGFRKVSSAERYQRASLEDLKKQVERYHPL